MPAGDERLLSPERSHFPRDERPRQGRTRLGTIRAPRASAPTCACAPLWECRSRSAGGPRLDGALRLALNVALGTLASL